MHTDNVVKLYKFTIIIFFTSQVRIFTNSQIIEALLPQVYLYYKIQINILIYILRKLGSRY